MNGKRILTAVLAVFCAAAGAGLLHAAASAADMPVSVSEGTIPADDTLSILFADITHRPDHPVMSADGKPDLSGLLVSLSGINAEGKPYDILTDVTPEEAKSRFDVQMITEPNDPNGWECTITFTAYSTVNQENVSASVKLMLDDAPETTAPVTTGTTAQTTANTTESTATTVTTAAAAEITTTVTTAPAPDHVFLLGDCNADSSFNIADAVLYSKWLTGAESQLPQWKAADFDGSGYLNAADLTLMKRALLGQLPDFPVRNPVVIDGFTPCTAQLSDRFSAWRISVVIKHQYSVPERRWTADDFAGVENIKSVKQYTDGDPYRQVLQIALSLPEKERVLEMIHSIEALGLKEIKEVQVVQDPMGDQS